MIRSNFCHHPIIHTCTKVDEAARMDSLGGEALNATGIILSGHLIKYGKKLGGRVQRWFVLTANGIFRCYADRKAKELKSDVVMRACHVTLCPADGKEPLKLVITGHSSDPVILWSEERDPDTRKWFEALKRYDSASLSATPHQSTVFDLLHPLVSNSSSPANAKSPSSHASPMNHSSTHAIQRAVQLYNTPVKSNKYAKFLVALGITSSSPFAWIAEHIARPPLPPDWEKLKDEKKRSYYANATLLQSSWEHPLLFYYPWLCRIFSKMLPIDASTNVPVNPEELIDYLTNDSNLLSELNLETECLPMHDLKSLQRRVTCDAVFYYSWLFSPRQGHSRHPYLKLSEERGWDPELVRSVAEYYGIDLAVEPHLVWLPKLALVAPLPPFWTSSEDDNGDTLFYCIVSGYCTQGHPVDRYITLLLQQSRLNMQLENHCVAVRAGWFDIIDADGTRAWYNMVAAESSAQAPPEWDDALERRLQASWNLDIEILIISLCHIRADQGLQPDWLLPPSLNDKLSRTEAAEAHPGASSHMPVSDVDVSFALEESFAEVNDDLGHQDIQNAVLSPGDWVQGGGSISGSEDDDVDGAHELLLPQDLENEVQGVFRLPSIPESRSIQTNPVDFRAPEVESTSYFVDGFSMSGAIRSGNHPVSSIGVQCILHPDSKDAACSANFAPEKSFAGETSIGVQDADTLRPNPAQLQLQDVIAHQLKVNLFCQFFLNGIF